MKRRIDADASQVFALRYPIGCNPDKSVMIGKAEYSKADIQPKVAQLADEKLALNGIYQLVTIIESLFGDLVRIVILNFPKKVGSKRTVKSIEILTCDSIKELHIKIANTILNELSYKSPKDFADETMQFWSINLLECPSFHKYIELKATRDIHIHNLGIVNDIYLSKASTHARAKLGQYLPVNTLYYLECYEACMQLVEWMEEKLHEVWHSSEREKRLSEKK